MTLTNTQIEKLQNTKFSSLKVDAPAGLLKHFEEDYNRVVNMASKIMEKRNGECKDHFGVKVEKLISIIDNGGKLEDLENLFLNK